MYCVAPHSLHNTHINMYRTTHTVTTECYIRTGYICTGPSTPVKECRDAYLKGCGQDGVYTIDPGCGKPFNVFCDMKNGGWTVFQRRRDGSEDFYRNWADYVTGFGNLKREFWLGLDHIHCLTSAAPRTELRVDLADFEGKYKYAQYSFFSVGNSGINYRLNIAGYTGTAGDSFLSSHSINGMQFSTKDRDNDQNSGNCASSNYRHGAWWHNDCTYSNLNGLYRSGLDDDQGVFWYHFLNNRNSLKFAQMKLRFRD